MSSAYEINSESPAFPDPSGHSTKGKDLGVTKFEYFVAAALTGLAANPVYVDTEYDELAERAEALAQETLERISQ